MTDPTRACLYLRTSTTQQHTDAQRPAVEQLAHARGYQVVGTYEEQVSAVKHRPQWDQLKQAAHRGEFEVLVIAAIDRLGRSMVGNLTEILTFDRMGIEVVSAREPWLQMGGPVRELLIGIFSWLGQEERRQLAVRSRAGVERARKAGKVIGRPKVQLDVDEALVLKEQGLSIREVARKLGVSRSVVHRTLKAADEGVPDPSTCGTASAV